MKLKTVYKTLNNIVDPVSYFCKLQDKLLGNAAKGNAIDCFLLESADVIEKYGDKSIGCVEPCLKIVIKDNLFEVMALNDNGKRFLKCIKNDFDFADILSNTDEVIKGKIKLPKHKNNDALDEESRLKEKNIFDVLRVIAFKFKPDVKLNVPVCGLFGAISYDAIDYFEDLPIINNEEKYEEKENETRDILDNASPDMLFYFADKLFVMDHLQKKTYLIASSLGADDSECKKTIKRYEAIFHETADYACDFSSTKIKQNNIASISISDEQFIGIVENIKKHIVEGDVFQCVISREFSAKISAAPLGIYSSLKKINPGPYMFYFNCGAFQLLGSSPETAIKVQNNLVEIKPIAGTIYRGNTPQLDSRYEMDLLLNEKELAEHCMLVDLARNDIARVSEPGSCNVPEILRVEKFSHVQHLVSKVQGKLRDNLDALHAYTATMNMGTLTGCPKIKAMELIRKYEGCKRGFYGGAICYITPDGDFDSCIIIRAITVKDSVAYVRTGAGIVYDSVPKNESEETKLKAMACLTALGVRA